MGEWLSANEHLPDAPVLKSRKSAAERRHQIAWGVSPRKSWSNQVLKAPEGRHRMKSHCVSPLRGFPLDNQHYSWGSRPRLFDAVPPGLKNAQLQNAPARKSPACSPTISLAGAPGWCLSRSGSHHHCPNIIVCNLPALPRATRRWCRSVWPARRAFSCPAAATGAKRRPALE